MSIARTIAVVLVALTLGAAVEAPAAEDRAVPLDGVQNTRDLGGLQTEDGRTVRKGQLIRSGEIDHLGAGGMTRLDGIGVSAIVDLRTTKEATANPALWPEGQGPARHNFPLMEQESLLIDDMRVSIKSGTATAAEMDQFFQDAFGYIATDYTAEIRALFDVLLAQPEGEAVLFHCSGGKDRTGVATALILSALGVPREEIEADFMMSNTLKDADNTAAENAAEVNAAQGTSIAFVLSLELTTPAAHGAGIAHDAEYYILEAQNAEKWAADDTAVDEKLTAFRERNDGKPPNILYILIDDIGFGDLGIPELNAIRGYKTPNINQFSDEGMRFARMYTEPSCTPTRVAFMTGRQPYRYGMGDTAVDIAGFGLPGEEVTLAEILSETGYNTVHIGKWHMGDIMEAWPTHQGFDFAAFPIHQQGQLTIYNDDAAKEEVTIGIGEDNYDDRFTLDNWFRPDASHMATVVEGKRGEPVREVRMKPGERWTQAKYDEMNAAFQQQALEHLRELAAQDEPFFLQYWPVIPLYNVRTTTERFTTPNGGTYVESMKQLDGWIGEILAEMDALKLTDNTIVVIMGDNGHFTKYSPGSGFTPMIFRGGKADTTEGAVRVDAFARWPSMIAEDSIAMDMVHVSDLFTTLARLGGATDKIPTDRVIDGVDQSALMLEGKTHGRRDHVMIYSGNSLKAVVKEQYKLNVPGPGENPIVAKFYDLFRDTREEYPVSTEVGAWGGQEFVRIIKRHMKRKEMYPDRPPAFGRPCDGIENLRPETEAAVEAFLVKQASPMR